MQWVHSTNKAPTKYGLGSWRKDTKEKAELASKHEKWNAGKRRSLKSDFFVHSSKHVYYLINSFTLVLEQNYSQKLQQVHLSSYCKAEFEKGMSVM